MRRVVNTGTLTEILKKVKVIRPEFVPLIIPDDWEVVWNNFTQAEPDQFIDENYIHVWEFQEDIFYFRNEKKKRILDLGWYPSHQVKGQYTVKLIQIKEIEIHIEEEINEDWENPLLTYKTRNINELEKKINWILKEVSEDRL